MKTKAPKGYNDYSVSLPTPKLPRGNYVCKITEAYEDMTPSGNDYIGLDFDICEGEYAGYYKKKFDADSDNNPEAEWKGNIRIYIPEDNDEDSIKRFKRTIANIEEDNEGFHFDWTKPVKQFNGLVIGVKFQPSTYNGYEFQKPKYICSANRVRKGTEKLLDPSNEQKSSAAPEPQKYDPDKSGYKEIEDSDLPF